MTALLPHRTLHRTPLVVESSGNRHVAPGYSSSLTKLVDRTTGVKLELEHQAKPISWLLIPGRDNKNATVMSSRRLPGCGALCPRLDPRAALCVLLFPEVRRLPPRTSQPPSPRCVPRTSAAETSHGWKSGGNDFVWSVFSLHRTLGEKDDDNERDTYVRTSRTNPKFDHLSDLLSVRNAPHYQCRADG